MTDARLPGPWLTNPTMDGLSDRAWRTFTGSLMWSNEAGTDGRITTRSLRFLHPEGTDDVTRDELVRAELWALTADGIEVCNWTVMGQELAATVAERREAARVRAANYRAGNAGSKGSGQLKRVPTMRDAESDATRDVTRDVGADVGQDTARTSEVSDSVENAADDWPTRQPGSSADGWVVNAAGDWEEAS